MMWRCFVAPRLLIELKCLHWSFSCFRGFELIKPATFVARFIQHDCLFLVSLDSLFRPGQVYQSSRPTLIDLAQAMGTRRDIKNILEFFRRTCFDIPIHVYAIFSYDDVQMDELIQYSHTYNEKLNELARCLSPQQSREK